MFWQNFTRLCEQSGKSPTRVAAELGFTVGSVAGWKKGAEPRNSTLKQIADYFGVPVETLTADASTSAPTPEAGESELVMYYRHFTREGKGRLLDFAESMKRSGMYEPGVDYFARGMNAEY